MTDTERPEDAFWPYWVEAARQQGFEPDIEAALFGKQRYFLDADKIFYYAAYGPGYDFDEEAEDMDLHEFKAGWVDRDGDQSQVTNWVRTCARGSLQPSAKP